MIKKVYGCKSVVVDNPEIKKLLDAGEISVSKAFTSQLNYDRMKKSQETRKKYSAKKTINDKMAQDLLDRVRRQKNAWFY